MINSEITYSQLLGYILQDEYWLEQAIDHFLLTASKERLECLEESYEETYND